MNLIEELEAEIGAAADLRNPEVVQAAFDLASRIPTLNSLVGIYAKRLADMRLTIPAQVRWCPNCLYPENANSFASMLYKYQQEQMKLTKLRRADIALSRIDGQVEWLVRRRQALKMIWPCKDCMEKYNPTGRSNHKEPHTYPANVNWRRGRKVPGGWETSQEQQDRNMRNSILAADDFKRSYGIVLSADSFLPVDQYEEKYQEILAMRAAYEKAIAEQAAPSYNGEAVWQRP